MKIFFKDSKTIFLQKDFFLLYASIFGDTPLDEEIKFIFNQSEEVNIQKIENFFKSKMEQYNQTDLHVLEIFRALDKESKCFITAQDIVDAWNRNRIHFSLEQVIESFNLVASEENILDYFSFRDLFGKSLGK